MRWYLSPKLSSSSMYIRIWHTSSWIFPDREAVRSEVEAVGRGLAGAKGEGGGCNWGRLTAGDLLEAAAGERELEEEEEDGEWEWEGLGCLLSPACPLNSSRKRCLKESATLLVSLSYFAARYRGRWVSMISKSQLQTTPAMACPCRELQMAW